MPLLSFLVVCMFTITRSFFFSLPGYWSCALDEILLVCGGMITSLTVVLLCLIKSTLFGCFFMDTCVLSKERRGSGCPTVALVSTTPTFLSALVLDLGFEAVTLAYVVVLTAVVPSLDDLRTAPCVLCEAIIHSEERG